MSLVQVVYASSATELFNKEELLALLKQSRIDNTARDVTGILLYKDGSFMQVLEGEAETVDALLQKISHDRRHKGVLRLLRRKIAEREFPDWSMAFRDLKDLDLQQFPGFSPFLNVPLTDPLFHDDRRVVQLIANFAYINR